MEWLNLWATMTGVDAVLDARARVLADLSAGNVADAARLAERNRTEFYRLIQKHGLAPRHFREGGEGGESAGGEPALSGGGDTPPPAATGT